MNNFFRSSYWQDFLELFRRLLRCIVYLQLSWGFLVIFFCEFSPESERFKSRSLWRLWLAWREDWIFPFTFVLSWKIFMRLLDIANQSHIFFCLRSGLVNKYNDDYLLMNNTRMDFCLWCIVGFFLLQISRHLLFLWFVSRFFILVLHFKGRSSP